MSDPMKEMAAEIYMRAVAHDVVTRATRGCSAGEVNYKRLTEEAWRAAKTFSKCSHEGAAAVDVNEGLRTPMAAAG